MNTDPIADYLTRIRNASRIKHLSTTIPYSKVKEGITKVLVDNNFVENYKVHGNGINKIIEIGIKKWNKEPLHLKRISKPGQRIYLKNKDIKIVKSGLGIFIVSTPKGIMCSKNAKKNNLGGEIICEVY